MGTTALVGDLTGYMLASRGSDRRDEKGLDRMARGSPTPTARDHKNGATTLANTPVNGLLGRQVLVTPMAGSDTSEPRRTLNPLFVEALNPTTPATVPSSAESAAAFNPSQSHTVRGAMAGALKKRLGLEVTSKKVGERERVYFIRQSPEVD